MSAADGLSLDALVTCLKAAGEETRLRLLALLAQGDLSVSDLTDILSQSQPRISRHLKLLLDAGLIVRQREGAWAFFRLADGSAAGALVRPILAAFSSDDVAFKTDRERLSAVRAARTQAAQSYFARHAADWDRLRSLHVPEAAVEAAILELVGRQPLRALIDLGTGTGRMLVLLAFQAERAVGIDASHAMLAVARANLEKAGLTRVELRQGDLLAPPVEKNSFDLVILHQVLHFLDDPARALQEAARLVAPGGRMLIIDFAPHQLDFLREAHAHRRLGFSGGQIAGWLDEAGLDCVATRHLTPARENQDQLTVSLWLGQDRRVVTDWPLSSAGSSSFLRSSEIA